MRLLKCKHKNTTTSSGWEYCLDCKKYLFVRSTERVRTFLDKDGSDTPIEPNLGRKDK